MDLRTASNRIRQAEKNLHYTPQERKAVIAQIMDRFLATASSDDLRRATLSRNNTFAQFASDNVEFEARNAAEKAAFSTEGNPKCTYCGFELDDDEEGDMHEDCSRRYNRG